MATHGDATQVEGSSVELEFGVRDRACFFIRASERAACHVELAEMIQRSDDQLLEFFTVRGASPDEVLTAAETTDDIADARLVRDTAEECLFEFVVAGPCVGETLADAGAIVQRVVADEGIGHVVAHVPPHVDAGTVISRFRGTHGGDLLARRQRDRPAPEFSRHEFRQTLLERMTERQAEALRTAYAAGYYNWPRESTAEECAEALDIAQPTFTQHLRAGEQKLLSSLFDDAGVDTEP